MNWLALGGLFLVAVLSLAGALVAYKFQMAVRTRNAFAPQSLDHPLVGRPAPLFELTTPEGKILRLGSLRGKTVVLSFWSSF